MARNYWPLLAILSSTFIVFASRTSLAAISTRMIDRHRLDMTHVTERVGSPQTRVCTKVRRTFNARMKEYRSEMAAMRKR